MKVPKHSEQLAPKAFHPRDVSGFMVGIAVIQWGGFGVLLLSILSGNLVGDIVFLMGLVYGGVLALPWADVATRGFGRLGFHTRECIFYMWFGSSHEVLPSRVTKCQCLHHVWPGQRLVST